MKKRIVYCMLFLLFAMPCLARDFIVQFVEENYKETQSPFSYHPIIYHSFQVVSPAGPKLLILEGEDSLHRKWLRQYVAKGKAFVVKVPDDQADLFITSSAFKIDVTDIHPMNLARYRESEMENQTDPDRYGPEKNLYGSGRPDMSDMQYRQNQKVEQLKKDQANQIQKAKADQKAAQKKAIENRQLEQQAQKQRLAAQELERKRVQQEALEKERLDQAKLAAQLAAQRAVEEEQRQQELELRWQELKKRLLDDENIRRLDQAEREQELNRRWLELRQRLGI